ncbi:hypothetical protein CONPUDRAFT_80228 [Coniophora puteana RWD-64-598 SS2]|uniref:DUF6593 domain-containing protein n=1 Tax=Coniophora puteana (strain RWD-64-598) TaxID=741705 RepID=A0A5M3N471_CONPW|nr:uncharacterized protein CONPUDRAFT_80228 [Coniophora puteana RWD-64-598 SS2]EIW85834.1 hypothetical protein CONPUDRAFT_80228 [Coniophora puteana RWD-64-598 SS2]
MESQETLINQVPPQKYYFSLNSVKKTTLFLSTTTPNAPTYTVSTDLKTDKHTEVKDAHGDVIAVWSRKDLLPDTIAWPGREGGNSTAVKNWLKKGDGADGIPVHTLNTAAGPIVFRSSAKHRVGAYFPSKLASAASTDETEAIAYLVPKTEEHNLALVLSAPAQATDVRDEIMVAVLILEHKLRMADTAISVGGGKFEQNKTVAGYYVST